jgi:hypothetical protein
VIARERASRSRGGGGGEWDADTGTTYQSGGVGRTKRRQNREGSLPLTFFIVVEMCLDLSSPI